MNKDNQGYDINNQDRPGEQAYDDSWDQRYPGYDVDPYGDINGFGKGYKRRI